MPHIEVLLRWVPDSGEEQTPSLVRVVEIDCNDFGPGPWDSQNRTTLMDFIRISIQRFVSGYRQVTSTLADITRSGVVVDPQAVRKILNSEFRDEFFRSEPEPLPPTRFERKPVI
jgi:hypothetical protein